MSTSTPEDTANAQNDAQAADHWALPFVGLGAVLAAHPVGS